MLGSVVSRDLRPLDRHFGRANRPVKPLLKQQTDPRQPEQNGDFYERTNSSRQRLLRVDAVHAHRDRYRQLLPQQFGLTSPLFLFKNFL